MDRRTFEEIWETLRRIEALRIRLDGLLTDSGLPGLTDDIQRSLARIAETAEQQTERKFAAALARINFQDRGYTFLRVIDGDTLEVLPPDELLSWMRDVHIRLYGVDAPESNTELGPTYTEILRQLCGLDEGRLHVIWERERKGTEYAAYPTGSFERGIANIFVDIGEGKLLYINAVLASLPDIQIERGTKRLIRAARHSRDMRWLTWRHPWHFPPLPPWPPYYAHKFLEFLTERGAENIRSRFQEWSRHHGFPIWVLRRELLPPSAHNNWLDELHRNILDLVESCDCPLCKNIANSVLEVFPRLLERENATPFDLLLLLAYATSHPARE